MELKRYEQAADFATAAEPFLGAHEAHNCLLLGLTTQLREPQRPGALPPYFAVVEDGGQVVAAALMTPPRPLALARTERPEAVELLAREVCQALPDTPGVSGPAPASGCFAAHWQALTGQRPARSMAQRVYQLTRVRPPAGVPGRMRRAEAADRERIVAWQRAFVTEALPRQEAPAPEESARMAEGYLTSSNRGLWFWTDEAGQTVSMAGHTGPTPRGVRINAVYTPPEHRGRGYASANVAALSQRMLDDGRTFCFLFTDLANPTSNHIYQAIGYEPVCDVDVYRFGGPGPVR
jgi:predicted GNAT family acetyltransferase